MFRRKKGDELAIRREEGLEYPRRYWSPFSLMREMDRMLEDLRAGFDELFWGRRLTTMMPRMREPLVDIRDTGKEYQITAELPGVSKDEIEVNLTEDGVELSAEKKTEKEERDEGYILRERGYSSFCRTFRFPDEVNPEEAKATFNHGVLEITIPKKRPVEEKKRRLKIE